MGRMADMINEACVELSSFVHQYQKSGKREDIETPKAPSEWHIVKAKELLAQVEKPKFRGQDKMAKWLGYYDEMFVEDGFCESVEA